MTINDNDLGEISDATDAFGMRQIKLSWTNPPANSVFAGVTIAQYVGESAVGNCHPSGGVTIIDANKATSRTITGLIENEHYSFRICARDTRLNPNNGNPIFSSGVALNNIIPNSPGDIDRDKLIEIRNLDDFDKIRSNLNGRSTECVNCIGFEVVELGHLSLPRSNVNNWAPIGSSTNPFTATFEGNGIVIDNVFINFPNADNIGIFGAVRWC